MPNPNINYQPKPREGPHRDPDSKITSFYGDYGERSSSIRHGKKRISWSQNMWKGLTNAELNKYLTEWKHV